MKIIIKKIIDYYRRKRKLKNYGKDNFISHIPKGVKIFIYGNNNKILIDSSIHVFKCYISIGDPSTYTNNCTIKIGKGSSSNGINIVLFEDNSSVNIGEDCMFSWNIRIWNTDSHTIIDNNSKKAINIGKEINIGNHVWVCMDTCILKNTKISSNSIVAAGTIVTKKFNEENIIIGGNPSRVIKKEINWNSKRVNEYIKTRF